MRQFFILFLLSCLSRLRRTGICRCCRGINRHGAAVRQYDMSGLSNEEQEWFLTFLEGNFFADGWDQITDRYPRACSTGRP